MSRVSELHIPDVGTVRPLTDLGMAKVRRCKGRDLRHLLRQALAVGMSLKEFKRLSPQQQEMVWRAVCALAKSGR
jgi:hypothetical protein